MARTPRTTNALRRADETGMTMLEVAVAMTILTLVMGLLYGLASGLDDTARLQDIKVTGGDEARKAMITVTRDIRQSAKASITGTPGASLTYRIPADLDGNGTPVDVGGYLEVSPARTIQRDVDDLNHDGIGVSQLVLRNGANTSVLANGLVDNEDLNGNGVLDAGEDRNGNGQLDRGIWFERAGNDMRITVQIEGATRRGRLLMTELTETVVPRN
jgi:hypothetical protein